MKLKILLIFIVIILFLITVLIAGQYWYYKNGCKFNPEQNSIICDPKLIVIDYDSPLRPLELLNILGITNVFSNTECGNRGGHWKCYGWCFPTYPQYCRLPLNDAGKTCTDSKQCKGQCVADNIDCENNCIGKCSKYFFDACENPVTINNGKVVGKIGIVCD